MLRHTQGEAETERDKNRVGDTCVYVCGGGHTRERETAGNYDGRKEVYCLCVCVCVCVYRGQGEKVGVGAARVALN